MADRLRGLRYAVGDLLYVVARVPRAIASAVAEFWHSLPIVARRRLVAAVGVIAVVLLFAGAVVPNLPCSFPGGDQCAPDDDAVDLTPASAIAYVHGNFDPETEQAELAGEVAGRMPSVTRQVISNAARLLNIGGPLGAASEEWFGGEAAAFLIGGPGGDRAQLLETTDADGAREYAQSVAVGVPETSRYRDVQLTETGRGSASAVVDDFLVMGTDQSVRAVIDVATGAEGAESLAGDAVSEEALDALPEHRVLEAYFTAEGLDELVASPRAPLSAFEPLADTAVSRGAAVGLSAHEEGFSLAVRSVLDPERSEAEPGFFAAFEEFSPTLPEDLQADSLAYLGLGQPSDTITALLRQASVRAPGIAAGVTNLIEDLRGLADVDIQRDLLEALGGEAALAVVPRAPVDPESELLPAEQTPTPFLEFLADDVDEDRAREALARLQGPIAESFDPELGAPVFREESVGDVDAQVLRLSPVAQVVYAIFDSTLVIANDLAAIEYVADGDDDGLAGAGRYESTVDSLPDDPSLIGYLDLRGLLAFAERSGLAEDPAYTAFAPDLRRLGSFGFVVKQDDDLLATDARLLVD